jgi:hypothetical protein
MSPLHTHCGTGKKDRSVIRTRPPEGHQAPTHHTIFRAEAQGFSTIKEAGFHPSRNKKTVGFRPSIHPSRSPF